MKRFRLLLASCAALVLVGCAVNRPDFRETTIAADGSSTERRLSVSTWSLWPASTDLAKQRASLGKTMTLGTSDLGQESNGTNVVETLRALDSILSRIRP
jgi:hypothetical protein